VLNLFLALLLSSFGAENLQSVSSGDTEPNKMQEASERINRLVNWLKVKAMQCAKHVVKKRKAGQRDDPSGVTKTDDVIMDGDGPVRNGRICDNQDSGLEDDDRKSISSGTSLDRHVLQPLFAVQLWLTLANSNLKNKPCSPRTGAHPFKILNYR
jgi:hypothetical protein